MKKSLSLFLLVLAAAGAQAEASAGAVDLDSLDPAPSAPTRAARVPAASPFHFSFFGDFILQASRTPAASEDWALGFLTDHGELFLKVDSPRGVTLSTDLVHIDDYMEFSFPLTGLLPAAADWPVVGSSEFRVGKILVPVGEFKFHHLYGGSVAASEAIVANLWTDLGAAWKLTPVPGVATEVFVLNGIDSNSKTFLLQSAGDIDGNTAKAWGGKVRWTLPVGFVSASALTDTFGADRDGSVLVAAADLGLRAGPFQWDAAGLWATGSNPDFGVTKWGWYTQGVWRTNDTLSYRCRLGQVDTNTAVVSTADQSTGALALLFKAGVFDADLGWTVALPTADLGTAGLDQANQTVALTLYFML